MSEKARPVSDKHALTAPGEANGGRPGQTARACPTCLKHVQGRRRFCSAHCRLLFWAVRALAEALKAGKAEGLRPQIRELFADNKLTVEVVHTGDERRPS